MVDQIFSPWVESFLVETYSQGKKKSHTKRKSLTGIEKCLKERKSLTRKEKVSWGKKNSHNERKCLMGKIKCQGERRSLTVKECPKS